MSKTDYKAIQSVARTFQILELLAQNPEGLSILALSEKTGLSGSTVHRLLHTLYALGYTIRRHSNSAPYQLSTRLFEFGNTSIERQGFIQKVRPSLDHLSEDLNLTSCIFVPEDDAVICVMLSTRSSFSSAPALGSRLPMWCSAVGKCFLVSKSDEQLADLWKNRENSFYGPHSPTSLETLKRDIAFVKKNRYIFASEESQVGRSCLAVPLINKRKETTASLCICGAPPMFPEEKIESLASHLIQFVDSMMSFVND